MNPLSDLLCMRSEVLEKEKAHTLLVRVRVVLHGQRCHSIHLVTNTSILAPTHTRTCAPAHLQANELVYICLYLLNFYTEGSTVYTVCYYLAWPAGSIAFLKNLISVVHLYAAFYNIAVYDVSIDQTSKVTPEDSKRPSSSPSKSSGPDSMHTPVGRQVSDFHKDE